MLDYELHDSVIARVTHDRRLGTTLTIWAGQITKEGNFLRKLIRLDRGVEEPPEDTFVRITGVMGDSKPQDFSFGTLFVTAEVVELEERPDWSKVQVEHLHRLGNGGSFLARAPTALFVENVELMVIQKQHLATCRILRFEVDQVRAFAIVETEGLPERELKVEIAIYSLEKWPSSWQGLPGEDLAKRKWLIAQRQSSYPNARLFAR